MKTGRPRKPTALHLLQGTHRDDRHGDIEDEPTPASWDGEPPAWVKAAGRKLWAELAPRQVANGCLTEMDVEAFGLLCSLEAVVRRSPANHLKELAQVDRLMSRFGMTPSDRTRVHVEKKSENKFDKFLSKPK